MIKVPISDNYVMPSFQIVNKNQQQTQLVLMDPDSTGLYLLHQYYCTDAEDYADLIALLETQAAEGQESPYVLNPVVYLPIKFTNQEFQTSHFVQVLYQYGSHTLQQELYLRIQEKNYFQEHQIWSILGSILLGLKNLKDKQFTHSSICMSDVFVTKEGQIKICHPMFRTYDHRNSQQVETNYFERAIEENYYFAPEQLPNYRQWNHQRQGSFNQSSSRYLSQQQQQQYYEQFSTMTLDDMFKSDIFSAGMTILSLCMLYPIKDCYVKKITNKHVHHQSYQISIQSDRLGQYFNVLEKAYSQDLVNLLFSMLAYNSEERISIDELGIIIQQMIQAKQLQEEEEQQQQQENYLQSVQKNHLKKYQQDAKGSVIRKNHSTNNDNMTSQQRFGKFSRVSQASPLSGRKTPRVNHTYGAPLQHSLPDLQDKPSIPSIQCQIDDQNVDLEEYGCLNESQANIDCQQETNIQNGHNDNQKFKKEQQQMVKSDNIPPQTNQTTQSFNQTLKQYINNEMSSILQVNQTGAFEENQRKAKQKNLSSPQYVQSVMTSKELGSLPSDSTSFVVEKHVINRNMIGKENHMGFGNALNHAKLIQSKEMNSQRKPIGIQVINKYTNYSQVNGQMKPRSPNSLKQFLNTIKQHNNEVPKTSNILNQYTQNGISSARTYSQQTKENNHFNANQHMNITPKMMESDMKSSISLNKDYEKFMELQKKNPSSLYTDPEFLKAIREDVNKILNKRKVNLGNNSSPQTPICHHQPSSNQIFINGRKVDNSNKPQMMAGFIAPINYIAKPYPQSNISQFR